MIIWIKNFNVQNETLRKPIMKGVPNENRKRLDDFDDHDGDEINEDDLDDSKRFHNLLSLNKTV